MLRLIASRLIQLPLILAAIFAATFVLAWVVPGNPLERPEGRRPPKEVAEAMSRKYHLDNPRTFVFYYLRNALQGDLGPSLSHADRSVNDIIAVGLPYSVAVGVVSLVIALALGLAAGIIGALWPHSPLDASSLFVALVGVSLPTFVTGSVLLALAAGGLGWAAIGGWDWPGWSPFAADFWPRFADMASHIALPALTLSLAPAAYIARLIRLGLADVMSSDFIRTARAKGLSQHQALFRHALKIAFLPVLSFLGPAAAFTLTGSFVVEKIFAIPGIGDHFVNAVRNKDQFLLLGVVLIYSTMLILFNLAVDVAYAWVDPRIEV